MASLLDFPLADVLAIKDEARAQQLVRAIKTYPGFVASDKCRTRAQATAFRAMLREQDPDLVIRILPAPEDSLWEVMVHPRW